MGKRQRSDRARRDRLGAQAARNSSPRRPEPAHGAGSPRRPALRMLLFVALCAVCLAVAAGYTILAALHQQSTIAQATVVPEFDLAAAAAIQEQPHLIFRRTARDAAYGKIALAAL